MGGGGGVLRTITTDETFDPSKIFKNPQGRIGDLQGFSLDLGGQNGVGGRGGAVQVSISGPVTTNGLDAHGVLAQSIGGGGGGAIGGQLLVPSNGAGGASSASGDGGPVTVRVLSAASLVTTGDGAYGIIAQSIGGGGSLAGDLSAVKTYQLGTSSSIRANSGNGGAVSVTIDTAGVYTVGKYAPAIFAQSIGGGGGLVNFSQAGGDSGVLARGTAGGAGSGGPVTVNIINSTVQARGVGSAGIVAQSDGKSASVIQISVGSPSMVAGGPADPATQNSRNDNAAIRLIGGAANRIDNAGVINGQPIAILTDSSTANTTVTNASGGSINGDIIYNGAAGSLVDNQAGGVINAPTTINLGAAGLLRNAGTLNVGGIGSIGVTRVVGDLTQIAGGSIHIDVDARNKMSDLLQVTGHADLAGSIVVNPISFQHGTTSAVITADGGLVSTASVQGLANPCVLAVRGSRAQLAVHPATNQARTLRAMRSLARI